MRKSIIVMIILVSIIGCVGENERINNIELIEKNWQKSGIDIPMTKTKGVGELDNITVITEFHKDYLTLQPDSIYFGSLTDFVSLYKVRTNLLNFLQNKVIKETEKDSSYIPSGIILADRVTEMKYITEIIKFYAISSIANIYFTSKTSDSKINIIELILPTPTMSGIVKKNNQAKSITLAILPDQFEIMVEGSPELIEIPLFKRENYNFTLLEEELSDVRNQNSLQNTIRILPYAITTYNTFIQTLDVCNKLGYKDYLYLTSSRAKYEKQKKNLKKKQIILR